MHKYPFSYVYNLAGSLLSEVYPSGRVVNTKYDSANRVAQISGALGAIKTTYVSQFSYAAHGPTTGFVFNNNNIGVVSYAYNSRLQPAFEAGELSKSSSSLVFTEFRYYGGATSRSADGTGATDNGNPTSMMDLQIPGQVTNFTYDKVNRLESATEILRASGSVSWARNFNYDAFGNTWVTTNTGVPLAGNTPTSPGQFTSSNQIAGFSYDKAGNQTSVNGNTLTYDAENRLSKVVENGGATETYVYDGDGTRVQKIGPTGTTVFLHDALGQLVAEYSDTKTTSPCTTCYLVTDVLGSTRMVIDQGGSLVARHDFLPFGEEIPSSVGYRDTRWDVMDGINQKFTGKERDGETGLDYFGARFYGSALGRWVSPDRVNLTEDRLVSPTNTLNKYVYGGSNPLEFTDLDGEDITVFYTNGGMAGHTMMLAYDQSTGDSAVQSFGPLSHSASSEAEMGLGIPVSGTGNYGFADIKSADQLRQDYASITIQTSPEETQKVIQHIRTHSDGDYATYSNNCTTTCGKILRSLSLYKKNSITPKGFFTDLLQQYGSSKNPATIQHGQDYGKPRSGYNPFNLIFLGIQNEESASKQPKEVVKSKVCYSGDDGKQHCESSN